MGSVDDARVRGAVMLLDSASRALLGFFESLPEGMTTTPLVGGWTPAAHVWHVSLTNDLMGGIITGAAPLPAVPGRSDFTDAQWSFAAPGPVAAPEILMPPQDPAPKEAVERLRRSVGDLRPLIESLEPERARLTVQLPWARISLCQMAEWAGGHTLRHLAQVGRELHLSGVRSSASTDTPPAAG